jgi:DNA repair photolyase
VTLRITTRREILRPSKVEYADYAINHVQGCAHGCTYCYALNIAKRCGKAHNYDEWRQPLLVSNALELLDKELPKKAKKIKKVQLYFTNDPFMVGHPEFQKLTLAILEKLHVWGLQVETLTKGITPAILLDADKYGSKTWYGATVVRLDKYFKRQYEPYSASALQRIESLKVLHDAGLETWVSIEPYPTPKIINQRIENVLEAISFVDCIVFGRWNHNNALVDKSESVRSFYNARAYDVIDFCRNRGIASYIKSEVLT